MAHTRSVVTFAVQRQLEGWASGSVTLPQHKGKQQRTAALQSTQGPYQTIAKQHPAQQGILISLTPTFRRAAEAETEKCWASQGQSAAIAPVSDASNHFGTRSA